MTKKLLPVSLIVILAFGVLPAQSKQAAGNLAAQSQANLLINGHMDDINYPFYWRPTNHYVAGMWYEWWVGDNLPEFIDGGHPFHNECYPRPARGYCVHPDYITPEDNHSQGYIRWGAPYIAGIYQPVAVTPCQYYTFEIYNRNDDSNYHPKVGIDPTGWQLPYTANPTPPNNCPPTGSSPCPNPRLNSVNDFPSTLVWSEVINQPAYTWALKRVTAEALSTTITVWTFVAPDSTPNPSRSTYWDYGSLTPAPHPTGLLVNAGVLPSPDGYITNISVRAAINKIKIEWQTSHPATDQVLYHYVGSIFMPPLPPVVTSTQQFESKTDINQTLSTSHSFTLQNVAPGSVYDVALLSRRWTGSQCQTSVYVMRVTLPDMLVPAGTLVPTAGINNVISTTVFNAARIQWQTAEPTFAQILYHYAGPTSAPSLPPIANNTQQYEFKTLINPTARTAHSFKLTDLKPLSVYDVALLSCRVVNDECQTSIYLGRLATTDLIIPAGALPPPSPEIVGPIVLPFKNSAYLIWQSPKPAFAQALYHYIPPVSIPPTMTERIYLPLVAAAGNYGSTYNYEFRTAPITTPTTLHVVQLTGLLTDSLYSAIALSAWSEGGQDKIAVSNSVTFRTAASSAAPATRPQQLAEQLQACLNTQELRACVNALYQQ